MQLQEIKGIGPIRLKELNKHGIFTTEDLLMIMPYRYRDTTVITPVSDVKPGSFCCLWGKIKKKPNTIYIKGKSQTTVQFQDHSGTISVIWFNQSWIASQIHEAQDIMLSGVPTYDKLGRLRLVNPKRESEKAIIPEYRLSGDFSSYQIKKWIKEALIHLNDCCPETLPYSLRMRYSLCERNYALRQIHFPENHDSLALAQRRISFERLLFYQAALSSLRSYSGHSRSIEINNSDEEYYWKTLPFSPTNAQKKVLADILQDLHKNVPMHRLVQGDVGCGKTAVALGAVYCCARNGVQCALMAPTEILALQHYESAQETLKPLGISCGILLGSMNSKQKKAALKSIAGGEWQLIIGTHALISETVQYKDLALVITDEQHRFGVQQRKKLSDKGNEGYIPHVLVMSATPIPRTLALILYGDLDISVLDEMPPGRKPVKTHIVPENKRTGLYEFIRKQVSMGRQAYIVCPLVEENEILEAKSAQEVYAYLCSGPFSDLKIGLTYGSQDPEEKEKILDGFSKGKINVLVATTVIEVGVNVPNANIMIIENAERFGLSQLHQLRGRVGRGTAESWCFLLAEPNERLVTLCTTNDGFVIAQKDLEMRGPGEFLGTAQHGQGAYSFLLADTRLASESQQCLKWLMTDPDQKESLEFVINTAVKMFNDQIQKTVLN